MCDTDKDKPVTTETKPFKAGDRVYSSTRGKGTVTNIGERVLSYNGRIVTRVEVMFDVIKASPNPHPCFYFPTGKMLSTDIKPSIRHVKIKSKPPTKWIYDVRTKGGNKLIGSSTTKYMYSTKATAKEFTALRGGPSFIYCNFRRIYEITSA